MAPEAAAGGLLTPVQDGDIIELDVPARSLRLDVPGRRARTAPTRSGPGRRFGGPRRGWQQPYVDHVQQADTGVDLDFLAGRSGPVVARESH